MNFAIIEASRRADSESRFITRHKSKCNNQFWRRADHAFTHIAVRKNEEEDDEAVKLS
jgi:hypothetical protein